MSRRRLVAGVGVLLVAAGVAVAVADPFTGSAPAANGVDNGAATALTTVSRQDLSQQTQVSATLGYADASTVSVPSGTAPAELMQSQQMLASAQQTLAADQRALEQAQASLDADLRKVAVDCRGGNAAESGGSQQQGGGSAGPCAADAQAVTADRQSVPMAAGKVQADQRALSAAQSTLDQGEASAATYGQNAVYTMLPKVGQIVRRGDPLYAIDGAPAFLLYGGVPASRAFLPGMSAGADVAELNRNLRGYGAPSGDAFTSSTTLAIERLQSAHHVQATGKLPLGSVVFEPGAVRVTSVTPTAGSPVQAGPVLGITSTRRVVTIALDASQQTSIKVGDQVVITLPDNSTTPGHVSFVGTVATVPTDNGGNGSSSPTIEVDVTADHPAATGRLDQAPVDVAITTATVRNVLAVPVNALLALAGGGYAVEKAGPTGTRELVGVSVGLFDDAAGLVQVSGSGLAAGQRVVVPATS